MCPAQCAIEEVLNYRFEAKTLLNRRYGANSDKTRRGFSRGEEVKYISNMLGVKLAPRPEELIQLKIALDEFRIGMVTELLRKCMNYTYGNRFGEISEQLTKAASWKGFEASFAEKIPLIEEWILLAKSLGA